MIPVKSFCHTLALCMVELSSLGQLMAPPELLDFFFSFMRYFFHTRDCRC